MAVNETIVTGRKFRKCIDAATKAWQRISFWTKSSDVEFEDGKNAETKLGAIDGITDSLEDTSSRLAASAKAVSTLNNNLGGLSFGIDGDGNYGYYRADGSLIPFKSTSIYYLGTALSFNIKDLLPNVDYSSLTSDNFIIQTTGSSGGSVATKETKNAEHININAHPPAISFPSISYNASTGIASVNRGGARSYVWADWGVGGFYSNMAYSNQKVYLVIW